MKSHFIKHINASIRYHDLPGIDSPIIFIHGLGCVSSFDYPQIAASKHLSDHRRILVDLLGSGYSDMPDHFSYTILTHAEILKELIEYLQLNNFVIYGHSMGGSIAICLAELCKVKVKALIISEANLDSGGGFFSKKIAAFSEEDYVHHGHSEIIKQSIDDNNHNWATGLKNSLPLAINREANSLVAGQTPEWRKMFYNLNIPRTFIFGENSLPDPDEQELRKHNIKIEIVKDAGHSMAWENPDGLALAIKNGIPI